MTPHRAHSTAIGWSYLVSHFKIIACHGLTELESGSTQTILGFAPARRSSATTSVSPFILAVKRAVLYVVVPIHARKRILLVLIHSPGSISLSRHTNLFTVVVAFHIHVHASCGKFLDNSGVALPGRCIRRSPL